jgi:3-phosphoshikimate 1-carboxyvinyltransferase
LLAVLMMAVSYPAAVIDLSPALDRLPDPLPIRALPGAFDATIAVPGSKSLTCRAYVVAALAEGESRIRRPLRAADTDGLLAALGTLGAGARWEGDDVRIAGVGGRFPRGGEVNLGDGGAPARFMIAAACLAGDEVVVDGSPRMRERPVAEGIDLLRRLGARIEYAEAEGRLPVRVVPGTLAGGALDVPATLSSQFVSAILLVAPFLPRGVELRSGAPMTSESYVRLTVEALRRFGVSVDALRVAPQRVSGREVAIEPDASSAAYWMIAAAIRPPSRVRLPGVRVPSAQPDAGVAELLRAAGAHVAAAAEGLEVRGTGPLRWPAEIDASAMPDAAVAIAAASTLGDRPVRIRGLHTLRVKESDRIAALAAEIGRLGCTVEADAGSIAVDPSTRHGRPAVIETYGDHRMAMAFAVLGLAQPGLSIRGPACVAKSYPGFWSDLARLYDARYRSPAP